MGHTDITPRFGGSHPRRDMPSVSVRGMRLWVSCLALSWAACSGARHEQDTQGHGTASEASSDAAGPPAHEPSSGETSGTDPACAQSDPPPECTCGAASCDDPVGSECPAGHYAANGRCLEWTQCAAGEFVVQDGAADQDRSCAQCEGESFSSDVNATSCTMATACAAGEYSAVPLSWTRDRECRSCPDSPFGGDLVDGSCLVWAARFGTRSGWSTATSVRMDGAGDVYVAGFTEGDLFGLGHHGQKDAFVMKVAGTGGTLLWARQFGTPSDEMAPALEVGPDGAPIVAFRTEMTRDVSDSWQDIASQLVNGLDSEVLKLDGRDGATVWSRKLRDVRSLSLDGEGDIAVAAWNALKMRGLDGSIVWSHPVTATLVEADARGDVIAAEWRPGATTAWKLSGVDGSELWRRPIGELGLYAVRAVDSDRDGDLYLTGQTRQSREQQVTRGQMDAAVFKLSGADGATLWMQPLGSLVDDDASGVRVDAGGAVWVAGTASSDLLGAPITPDVSVGGFVMKFAGRTGERLWVNHFLNPYGFTATGDVEPAGDDLVVAAGTTGIDLTGYGKMGERDIYVLKLATGAGDTGGRGKPAPVPLRMTTAPQCAEASYARQRSGSADRFDCVPITECADGTIEAAAPSATDDRHCAPCPAGTAGARCEPCARGFDCPGGIEAIACDSVGGYDASEYPGSCIPWSECGVGEREVTPSSTSDRSCRLCESLMCAEASGNSPLYMAWGYQFGTAAADRAQAVAIDPDGDLVVSSSYNEGYKDGSPPAAYVHKLSPDGRVRWNTQFASGWLYGTSVATLEGGDVVAVATVGTEDQLAAGIVTRLSARDGTRLWRRSFGSENEWVHDVAVDSAGDIVAVGDRQVLKLAPSSGRTRWRAGLTEDAAPLAIAVAIDGADDIVVVERMGGEGDSYVVKRSGADGREMWRVALMGQQAEALAVDAAGDVLVAGRTPIPGTEGTMRHAFALKLSATGGEPMWRNDFEDAPFDTARAIQAAADADVWVAGVSREDLPGGGWLGDDAFIARLSGRDGSTRLLHQFGVPSIDGLNALAVRSEGIIVAGETEGELAGTWQGGADAFVIALDWTSMAAPNKP